MKKYQVDPLLRALYISQKVPGFLGMCLSSVAATKVDERQLRLLSSTPQYVFPGFVGHGQIAAQLLVSRRMHFEY